MGTKDKKRVKSIGKKELRVNQEESSDSDGSLLTLGSHQIKAKHVTRFEHDKPSSKRRVAACFVAVLCVVAVGVLIGFAATNEKVQEWCTGLGSVITIKLASSVDDVVWLAAFLTPGENRGLHALIYLCICLVQTVLAMLIAFGGAEVVEEAMKWLGLSWSADEVLTICAATFMSIYSVKLYCEYRNEQAEEEETHGRYSTVSDHDELEMQGLGTFRDEEDEETEEEDVVIAFEGDTEEYSDVEGTDELELDEVETGEDVDDVDDGHVGAEQGSLKRAKRLAVVAFIGSLDDLTLFVPMLVGKAFGLEQLAVGATIAALLIVALCMCLTLCKPMANCLQRVPLFAIVGVFSCILIIKAIVGFVKGD